MDDEHISDLESPEHLHLPGEENGCVTRCLYKKEGKDKNTKFVCLYEGHNYRINGYNYTFKNEDELEWYNIDLKTPGPNQDKFNSLYFDGKHPSPYKKFSPTNKKKLWWLGSDSEQCSQSNFKNQYWPWPNEAHHIIPVNGALFDMFEYSELKLLLKAKYNVNRGVNIIILPCRKRLAQLYNLPSHWYHSTYSKNVRNKIKKIKRKLAEYKSQEKKGHPEITEENVEGVSKELEAFSKNMRMDIRDYGISSDGGKVNDIVVR